MTQQEIEDIRLKLANAQGVTIEINDKVQAALERLEKLETAVAWHGWNEAPEGGPFRIIELRRANGKINKGDKINFERYKNNPDFTGWRYPVGDLSE